MLLDAPARTRIEAAIAEVERRTAGEFVVVCLRASDAYLDLRLLYAASCAPSVAALVHWLWPALEVSWLLWLQLPVAALCMLVTRWRPLLRVLLPRARSGFAVQRRAREAFLAHAVFATRDRTGLLILLSELERQVVILGDAGIHAHVQDAGWQRQVDQIVAAIHAGDPARGVCEVITAMGEVLAERLPVRPDDRDELPNRVRLDEH